MDKMKKKNYTYGFVGGGWNCEYAVNKRQAIAHARKRFPNLEINVNTFNVVSDDDLRSLYRQTA